ncbi:MAG: glutamyl-tRNA reductase [bacterium]|nr:MAG: glutamyl-tRNA reductase [bacterium]
MRLFVAGVNYRTAPVEFREKVAVRAEHLFSTGWRLRHGAGLSELVILSTCNRVELYGVAPDSAGDLSRLLHLIAPIAEDPHPYVYVHEGAEAIAHLIKVTSGLDSMILGETDVQKQVKDAWDKAHLAGLTGKVLNLVFQKALHATKEIRTHTTIGVGTTSVGAVAVSLASKIFGERLADRTILLIGAGQMAATCLRHFVKYGASSFIICNRSPERARHLVSEFGGRAITPDDLDAALIQADIVVSATGAPGYVLDREGIEAIGPARGGRPLFLVDIAVPRDIEPDVRNMDGVFLYNIDDLEAVVNDNLKNREGELDTCDVIIKEKIRTLLVKLGSMEELASDDHHHAESGHHPTRHASNGH